MSTKILVFLEQRNGEIKKQSLEPARKGFKLSKELNGEVTGIVFGDNISNIDIVSEHGLEKVIHFKNSKLKNYSSTAYSKLIADFVKENNFNLLLFSHTSMGKDIAPIVQLSSKLVMVLIVLQLKLKTVSLYVKDPFMLEKH
jgi:Electron transfer flavoprotein, alpha subunit